MLKVFRGHKENQITDWGQAAQFHFLSPEFCQIFPMSNPIRDERLAALFRLSHALGREDLRLAILAEGNTSAKLAAGSFLVKASGSHLGTLDQTGVVECRADILLPLLDKKNLTDAEIESGLLASRIDAKAKKP